MAVRKIRLSTIEIFALSGAFQCLLSRAKVGDAGEAPRAVAALLKLRMLLVWQARKDREAVYYLFLDEDEIFEIRAAYETLERFFGAFPKALFGKWKEALEFVGYEVGLVVNSRKLEAAE